MDFIKNIDECFETAIGIIEDVNIFDKGQVEKKLEDLKNNLLDTTQNYAAAPIVIQRAEQGIKDLEALDVSDFGEEELRNHKGMLNQQKINYVQQKGEQARAKEDIAYFKTLILNWQAVLDKFTK